MFALVALTFRVKLVTFSVIKVRKLLRQMGELVLQKNLLSGVDFMKRSHVKKTIICVYTHDESNEKRGSLLSANISLNAGNINL